MYSDMHKARGTAWGNNSGRVFFPLKDYCRLNGSGDDDAEENEDQQLTQDEIDQLIKDLDDDE